MRKQIITAALIAALPLAGLAQAKAPAQGQGPGPGAGAGPGAGQGAGPRGDPERMEKRMRLARTLGLAEALDLDAPQALKLGEAVSKFDERRLAAHRQLHDSRQVLRRAAQGESVAPAEVDQAIQKVLDARAQLQAVDREIVATVTKDLTPEKKARAVLFLSKFQRRFGPEMGPGRMGRGDGPGMRGGRGRGRGMGMGPGGGMGMGMGPGPGMGPPDVGAGGGDWDDEGDDE
jgi:hypothetical protein